MLGVRKAESLSEAPAAQAVALQAAMEIAMVSAPRLPAHVLNRGPARVRSPVDVL